VEVIRLITNLFADIISSEFKMHRGFTYYLYRC